MVHIIYFVKSQCQVCLCVCLSGCLFVPPSLLLAIGQLLTDNEYDYRDKDDNEDKDEDALNNIVFGNFGFLCFYLHT